MAMPRKRFTEADQTLIWDRWQRGESLHQIAQRLATRHSSIRQVLVRTGGIRPPSPEADA
jgi:IS30 family transposase